MIIAVSGQARNGKDTICDYFVAKYGFQKFAIAEPIKEICQIVFNFNQDQLYGDLKDVVDSRWGIRPRECFQFIGTELFRQQISQILPEIGQKIWIKSLCEKLRGILSKDPQTLIVISDVRFINEHNELANFSREMKVPFYSIRVENPRISKKDLHQSETIDWTADNLVKNDGTIDELYQKLGEYAIPP